MRIRIINVPSGCAPEWIRQQWVGIEMPVFDGELPLDEGSWSGNENINGYIVAIKEAVEGLRGADCDSAADFWESFPTPFLRFNEKDCEVIPN